MQELRWQDLQSLFVACFSLAFIVAFTVLGFGFFFSFKKYSFCFMCITILLTFIVHTQGVQKRAVDPESGMMVLDLGYLQEQ